MWRDTYELVVNCCADTADLADCGGGSQGNGKRNHFFYLPDCVVSCGWASGNGAWQILQKRYCRRDCNSGFAVDSVHCAQAFKLGVFFRKACREAAGYTYGGQTLRSGNWCSGDYFAALDHVFPYDSFRTADMVGRAGAKLRC